ncbi:hypothetical protein B0T24DRAFT_681623 [Lasiosphaeria ovina]|uniref:Uncharacterized protein n=1 Tax=Lasiosphaeria ovina TaxID=92902 RepID=A0AAE0K3X8_9PEZI|nr:hypothetical protein B0T24DRAFT_681623 [Lasiosphaeria ovina]
MSKVPMTKTPMGSPAHGSVVDRAGDNGPDTDPDRHLDSPGKRLESFHSPAALTAQRTVNGLTVPPARGGRGGKAQEPGQRREARAAGAAVLQRQHQHHGPRGHYKGAYTRWNNPSYYKGFGCSI